jgi:hypothetical protein
MKALRQARLLPFSQEFQFAQVWVYDEKFPSFAGAADKSRS